MSRENISTQIEDLKTMLAKAEMVRAAFPDARSGELPNGAEVWMSGTAHEHATEISVTSSKDGLVYFSASTIVGQGDIVAHVFKDTTWFHPTAASVIARLRKENPEAYGALVRAIIAESK